MEDIFNLDIDVSGLGPEMDTVDLSTINMAELMGSYDQKLIP